MKEIMKLNRLPREDISERYAKSTKCPTVPKEDADK